jgi:hypothetical protein
MVKEILEIVQIIADLGLAVFLTLYLIMRLDRTLGEMRDSLRDLVAKEKQPLIARVWKPRNGKKKEKP